MTQSNLVNTELKIVPADGGFAAEVQGADVRNVGEQEFRVIYQAWLDYSVLLLRGQSLTGEDLIAFSRRLGELDWAPIQENGRRFVAGHPELYVVSNVVQNGVAIGSLGAGEAVWHTDMSYVDPPPKASLLYSVEIPPEGGDTSFIDMYAVYAALPPALRARIDPLKLKHDGTYNSGGYLREGVTATDDPVTSAGTWHPLVCTHSETGRRMLYLGRRRNAYLGGLPLAESEQLLDELWSYCTAEHSWRHQWRAGDLVLWDNRCTMHRRDAFDPNTRRLLYRTQVRGDAPLSA